MRYLFWKILSLPNATLPRPHGPTLVDELVKSMLAIGPRLPPHNGACLVVHTGARFGDVFPIGLHVALLEVRSKAVQVLVIGQHGMRLTPKAVDVPDSQQGQQDGGVLLQGRRAEVLVLKQEQGEWKLSSCTGRGRDRTVGEKGRDQDQHTRLWPALGREPASALTIQ